MTVENKPFKPSAEAIASRAYVSKIARRGHFSRLIRKHMQRLNLTIVDIADATEMTPFETASIISCAKQVTLDEMHTIANAVDCSMIIQFKPEHEPLETSEIQSMNLATVHQMARALDSVVKALAGRVHSRDAIFAIHECETALIAAREAELYHE